MTPDPKRLLLTLLFLAADVRDHILYHFRPVLKGFSCSGNSLICSSDYLVRLELSPRTECRSVALDRTVRLYCDKSAGRAKSLLLELDHLKVIRVNLRDYHRNIRCPAVSAVVGNHRSLCLRVSFLDSADLFLCHINGAEYEINGLGYRIHVVYIHNN